MERWWLMRVWKIAGGGAVGAVVGYVASYWGQGGMIRLVSVADYLALAPGILGGEGDLLGGGAVVTAWGGLAIGAVVAVLWAGRE